MSDIIMSDMFNVSKLKQQGDFMLKINVLELLQQDIEDLKGVMNYKEYGLTELSIKNQARAIILNLQDHLDELIQG